jgi:hypothetical protein
MHQPDSSELDLLAAFRALQERQVGIWSTQLLQWVASTEVRAAWLATNGLEAPASDLGAFWVRLHGVLVHVRNAIRDHSDFETELLATLDGPRPAEDESPLAQIGREIDRMLGLLSEDEKLCIQDRCELELVGPENKASDAAKAALARLVQKHGSERAIAVELAVRTALPLGQLLAACRAYCSPMHIPNPLVRVSRPPQTSGSAPTTSDPN